MSDSYFSQPEGLPQGLPAQQPGFEQTSVPVQPETLPEDTRGALVRVAVNGAGIVMDLVPTIADPSTSFDIATTASRAANKVPGFLRRIKLVDKVVTAVENFDPTPDIPLYVTWTGVGTEVAVPLLPTSVPLRAYQIMKDLGRLRRARQQNKHSR